MIGFVVLHYKSIEETIICLKKIKNNFEKNKYEIIVVDNNSLKENEIELIKKYTKDIILLDKNYGFAHANNIGCKYAKEKYKLDFIALINNDLFIDDKMFISKIQNSYNKYNFDVLGPYIDSPTKESFNPFPVYDTKEKVIHEIKKCQKLIKIYNSKFLYLLLKIYLKIKHLTFRNNLKDYNGKKIQKNVAVHGCCMIFSKKYFEKYEDVLFDGTFLYHEEEFLYKRIINDDLISIYDPNIKVFHKEGSATKINTKNERLKKLFREKERLKSLNLLLEQM